MIFEEIKLIQNILNKTLEKYGIEKAKFSVDIPTQKGVGDLTTNVALTTFKDFKKSNPESRVNSPLEYASLILKETEQDLLNLKHDSVKIFSKIDVAKPAFINVYLTDEMLLLETLQVSSKGVDVTPPNFKSKKYLVEYSSPNIAKPFTIGHFRTTIIGHAIANLLETVGNTVYRDNHLGDWGTQFGKLIYAIKTWGNEQEIENSERPVKLLVDLYIKFHDEAKKNPELENKGREWFTKLEQGDKEVIRLWKKCIEWSIKEFDQTYKKLGVYFTENDGRGYGESYFISKVPEVLKELEDKNLLTESEGAKLVFFDNDELPPFMVLKKDGSTLYSTRDLATDKFRKEKHGDDITIINEVGAEQKLYFRQLFKVEEMLGWFTKGQRIHVWHGMFKLKEGKMSTREGNVVWLDDVLNEAFVRVKEMSSDLNDNEIWKIAVGALKWNDFKRRRRIDTVFDWNEILNIKGNSGPYIQYTYVRSISVLKNAKEVLSLDMHDRQFADTKATELLQRSLGSKFTNLEKELMRYIMMYPVVVNKSIDDLELTPIATYLYECAQLFNQYYAKQKLVDEGVDSTQALVRLNIVNAVAIIIKHGLNILGIDTVEKM